MGKAKEKGKNLTAFVWTSLALNLVWLKQRWEKSDCERYFWWFFCFKKRIAVLVTEGWSIWNSLLNGRGLVTQMVHSGSWVNFPPMSCHKILRSCPFLLPLEKGPATLFVDVEGNPMRRVNGITENRGAFFLQKARSELVLLQVKGMFVPTCVGSECIQSVCGTSWNVL